MRVTALPNRRSPGVRLAAAAAAGLITTALVLELARLPPAAPPPRAPVALPVTLVLPPRPPAPAASPAPAPARDPAPVRRPPPVPERAAQPAPITLPASPATAPAVARVEPPADAASAPPPLRLGVEVMRQAARDSLSQTRQLAAQAGQGLDDAPVSGAERLADGVRQSGKPDCLAANAGGSLLSLPIIALQALRQKCK